MQNRTFSTCGLAFSIPGVISTIVKNVVFRDAHDQGTSPLTQRVKNPPAKAGDTGEEGQSLGQEDSLEEEMATHSSTLSWKIPWTEEPGGLQSMRSQRVGHD